MVDNTGSYIRNSLLIACAAMLLLFGLAYAMPQPFWGINFPTYLPAYLPLLLFGLPFLGIMGLHSAQNRLAAVGKIPRWAWSLGAAGLMWFLHYNLYSETQLYGDSRTLLLTLDEGSNADAGYHWTGALSPNIFSSKNGEMFSYSLAKGIQGMLGCSVWGAFRVLTAIFGAIFAFVWVEYVQGKFQAPTLRLLAVAIGLLGGMSQVFFAHAEVYAAPMLAFSSYLILLLHYLAHRQDKWLLALAALLLLAIRTHSAGFALAPTFLYALVVRWAGDAPARAKWRTWRGGGLILLASLLLGILGYFTAFKAGAETLADDGSGKNFFLTLVGENSDDNYYGMFSPWHLWDFLQEILLVSVPSLAVLLAILAAAARGSRWNKPEEIALVIAFGVMAVLIFAIDPSLSMPRDWDLCGLFAPPMLLLATTFLARHEAGLQKTWLPIALLAGLAGLQFSAVLVNHDARQVHLRLLDCGKHVFATGHGGGAFLVRHASAVEALTVKEQLTSLKEATEFFAAHEHKYNRSEYAFLYQYTGLAYLSDKDLPTAESYFNTSVAKAPQEFQLYAELADVEYALGKPDKALEYANHAIRFGDQRAKTWGTAIRAAIILKEYAIALEIGADYTRRFGDPENLASELERVRHLTESATDSLSPPQAPH